MNAVRLAMYGNDGLYLLQRFTQGAPCDGIIDGGNFRDRPRRMVIASRRTRFRIHQATLQTGNNRAARLGGNMAGTGEGSKSALFNRRHDRMQHIRIEPRFEKPLFDALRCRAKGDDEGDLIQLFRPLQQRFPVMLPKCGAQRG